MENNAIWVDEDDSINNMIDISDSERNQINYSHCSNDPLNVITQESTTSEIKDNQYMVFETTTKKKSGLQKRTNRNNG